MNKKFSLLIFCFMLVCMVYSKSLYKLDGSIRGLFNNNYSNNSDQPLYSIEIICDDDAGELINGVICIKSGKKFTIKYLGASISGGAGSPSGQGGDGSSTSLIVTEINGNEIIHNINFSSFSNYRNESEFTAKENTLYNLNLIATYSSSGGAGSEKAIISKQIIGVDDICYINEIPMAYGYTGILSTYKGNFDKNLSTKTGQNYKLIIDSKDVCLKKDNNTQWPVWYVKKGQKINFDYKHGDCYYGGMGTNGGNAETKIKINGVETTKFPETVENEMTIELWLKSEGNKYKTEVLNGVIIKVDPEPPELTAKLKLADGKETIQKINTNNKDNVYSNKPVTITAKDKITAVKSLIAKKYFSNTINGTSKNEEYELIIPEEEGEYFVEVNDLVGNTNEVQVLIDKQAPEINAYYYDENERKRHSKEVWINQTLYFEYKDKFSGIPDNNGFIKSCEDTGKHIIKAVDNAGNTAEAEFLIDKIKPRFTVTPVYESTKELNSDNYKSCFKLDIKDIRDDHSGISGICVTPIVNEKRKTPSSITIEETEKGHKEIEDKIYTYTIPGSDRSIDNYIKFELTVTDIAGNHKTETLGGDQGYFVPASIFTDYEEPEEEKNRVKVNFYTGITSKKSDCTTANYTNIRLKRRFSLTNSKDSSKYDPITEASFGNTKADKFNTSAKGIWERLTTQTDNLKDKIISDDSGIYCIDTAVENTGFTHKNISYDCIYEYTNPVNPAETITETICNDTIIKLTNNKGRYSIRVRGEDNTYLVIDDKGDIKEGSTETFKMPDTGVVELAIKVEDPDIEEYQVMVYGYVELTSENGKFKLQETDTDPVGTEGIITGCGESEVRNDNKNVFISRDKEMDGDWVKIGEYALQYNVTTVLAVELTEGYSGTQEQWTDKTVRLYVQSPSVLGGKARLLVGDAGSYNAEGITARPNQPIKMEIVPAEGGQAFTDLFWDFGNGKTSKENDYGNYQKNSNSSFENIRYDQSPERTGALSEYTLKIKAGTDEAEFKVNIIDTQFGTLYGDEVWRGEHIIKKEIIVTDNKTLQIGDTAHSEYDSDITCLCVGKINAEDKGGITVEQGGTLILDEGDAKTIRFVQAGFKDDKFVEAAEEEKSWQNKWRGIVVKGNLSGDSLNLFDADCGLTVFPGVSIKLTDSIKMENCGNGILMNGESLKAKEIKLNSTLECENLFVNNSGRGVVLTENGSFTVDNLEIKDSITGIHLLGGNLEIGSGRISGCSEYGIKTDKDGSYNYESVIVEDNERNIYINGLIR